MNAYSRTLTLPSAVRPVREHGSSALDRAVTVWAAPDPATRVLDSWGAPTGPVVVRTGDAVWPTPDPAMRVDLPAPELRVLAPIDTPVPRVELIEPRHAVPVPDLQAASRTAVAAPTHDTVQRQVWPAPTLADAAFVATSNPDHSGISRRLVIGLAVTAGAVMAGATAFISLF